MKFFKKIIKKIDKKIEEKSKTSCSCCQGNCDETKTKKGKKK